MRETYNYESKLKTTFSSFLSSFWTSEGKIYIDDIDEGEKTDLVRGGGIYREIILGYWLRFGSG